MVNIRKLTLANEQYYHVFNRAIDRQTIFNTKWEYKRALETLRYYRYINLPIRLSQFLNLQLEARDKIITELIARNEKLVEIAAFCLMPNHFHLLLKQAQTSGISTFISNFSNSYTKYFNTKHNRTGHLFEGTFKAVFIETDEQLIHVSRYIHLNPVSSFIIKNEALDEYSWSSYPEYLNKPKLISEPSIVLKLFPNSLSYKTFVNDQVSYARELDKIKHLTID